MADRRRAELKHYTAAGGALQIPQSRLAAATDAYQAELGRVRSLLDRNPWDYHEELVEQAQEALSSARKEMEIAWLEECL